MKKSPIFYLMILILGLSACGPSQAELSIQTAIAETSIAASWTSTPTLTPTLTPTPTITPLPTATPIGGGQGQIIFLDGDFEANKWEIYSSNSNGTGRKQLTFLGGTIRDPVWSPIGDKIAFSFQKTKDDFWQIYTMNSDGSGVMNISASDQKNHEHPDWSPDGKKIVFESEIDEEEAKKESPRPDMFIVNKDVFIVNSDGTNKIRITNDPTTPGDDHIKDYAPVWSPDGSKIAFISYKTRYPDIFVMNIDGTERVALTDFKAGIADPSWSPDGMYIVFNSEKDSREFWEIYMVKSDGTDVVRVTNNEEYDLRPKFTPDGTKISFDSCCFNLSIMNLDGSDVVKLNSQFGWGFDWKP